MDVQLTVFSAVFTVAAAVSAGLAWYAWQRRRAPGGTCFALFMLAAAVYALGSALENSVADMPTKILFTQLAYPGVASIAPLWFLFTLDYSRRTGWLRSRWLPLLWVVPAVVTALAFTNEWHRLIWSSITPVSDVPGAILAYALGPATYVNALYAYTLMLGGCAILLKATRQSPGRSRLPVMTLIHGLLISLVTNLLYPTSLNPFEGLDVTPLAFVISGLLFTWAIFGQRLFELVPVARETLIQMMPDGAIVLDGEGRVVEINPAARRILGLPEDADTPVTGSAAGRWPALAGSFESTADAEEEVMIAGLAGAVWLEVRVSILNDAGGERAGRLVMLRDISKRRRAEEDLKRSNEALKGEVAEKTQAQKALNASLQEKEVLLKEIHHRVKNNLQIISSLLSLQSANHENNATEALRESQDRIRSMALIHEKLYRSVDVARVDFRDYAEDLTAGLKRSYYPGPEVRVFADVEDVSLDIDLAIPCGLIVNELVSNALKYAFPDGRTGEIRIGLARDGGSYTLTVADNGVGLPPGLDFRDTPSLGLQLVNMLVSQLEGTIELDSSRGTRFKITFAETE